jgi:hypothetical protein
METDVTIAGVDRMFACVSHTLVAGNFFLNFFVLFCFSLHFKFFL